MKEQVSLYFHVPFCTKKCPYCHFYVIPNQQNFHELLEQGFAREWDNYIPILKEKIITSIYFGGGTPTLFAPAGIKNILKRISESQIELTDSCEITIEANPEELEISLLNQLLEMGINRLSLGVQSLDDRSLETLERTHSAKKAELAILNAELAGFKNISIDLMYDIPNQTQASWNHTLSRIRSLPIQHLSLYNLTIEPHTSFFKRRKELTLPEPHMSIQYLFSLIQTMKDMKWKRYEISAFCKEGYASNHNLGYWTYRPFLGFGPSAFSFWNSERFQNVANIQRYAKALKDKQSPIHFQETLPYPQNIKEELAVRLRLLDGVDIDSIFSPREKMLPQETLLAVDQLMQQGFLYKKGSHLFLSEKGLLFYDTVASEII